VGRVELSLGPPHGKQVHGIVRDRDGRPVAGASVSAEYEDEAPSTQTDASGRYTLETFSGARLEATEGARYATASVSGANVDREQIDLVLEDLADDYPIEESDEPSSRSLARQNTPRSIIRTTGST